jgi:predicted RNase H-like nuclease (RuvC/YqgF family)
MVGLAQFIELSLVARGAADKPKIVGKSQSKVAPESAYRLAAKGFEADDLVVQAQLGKEEDMDTTKLVSDLAERTGEVAVLKADVARFTSEKEALTTQLSEKDAKITDLETQLAAAKDEKPEDYESAKAERDEAVTVLQEQLNGVRVALGETKLEGEDLPSKIADLKSAIDERTGKLTALLPTDGKSAELGSKTDGKRDFAGFKTNK